MATPAALPPNQTLYINNLNDKLAKPDLRVSLYTLFSTYGVVLDVVALKTRPHRGQAHVAFRDVGAATQAMRACQGMAFFGKDMRIAYAKSKSNKIAKLDGTFKIPVMTQGGGLPGADGAAKPFVPLPGQTSAGATAAVTPEAAVVGQKRLRDEKEGEAEEESEGEEMEMEEDD
ncbi:hypothetical protein EDC01DRAFT_670497, partial [Geopyxis carbonaria]